MLALIVGMALAGITAFGIQTNASFGDSGGKLKTYMHGDN
jgi:hypothetical protein